MWKRVDTVQLLLILVVLAALVYYVTVELSTP